MAYQETDYTRRQRLDMQTSLLKAGHRILAKEGFAGISVARVAAAAGMASGNLYRYFDNKDELMVALFERATDREIAAVFDAVNPSTEPGLQLQLLLIAFAQRALANPRLSYALIAEPASPALEQARLHYRMRWANGFADLIERGIAQGVFVNQPALLAATALVGAMAETVQHYPHARPITADDSFIDDLVQFCMRALRKPQ